MKRRIRLAAVFVLLGLAALGLSAAGQSSFSGNLISKIEFGPHPRDLVQIREGVSYVVPTGRIFVLTALGGREYADDCCPFPDDYRLAVNGQVEVLARPFEALHTPSLRPVPPGFTVASGQTIALSGGATTENDARAWGYLAEPLPPGLDGKVIRVPYAPHPSDMVRFGQGSFFIVPSGKIFVLTALGTDATSGLAHLRVNAQLEVSCYSRIWAPTGNPGHALDVPSFRPIPLGFALPAGSIVEVTSDFGSGGEAWGYLADA